MTDALRAARERLEEYVVAYQERALAMPASQAVARGTLKRMLDEVVLAARTEERADVGPF